MSPGSMSSGYSLRLALFDELRLAEGAAVIVEQLIVVHGEAVATIGAGILAMELLFLFLLQQRQFGLSLIHI